jgi:hypothetical protein
MISTVIAISVWVPVSLFAAVMFYCLVRSGEDGRPARIQPEDEVGGVATERGTLRVVWEKDKDG